jgi:hypothetical protein
MDAASGWNYAALLIGTSFAIIMRTVSSEVGMVKMWEEFADGVCSRTLAWRTLQQLATSMAVRALTGWNKY